jgi:hypothetical protein
MRRERARWLSVLLVPLLLALLGADPYARAPNGDPLPTGHVASVTLATGVPAGSVAGDAPSTPRLTVKRGPGHLLADAVAESHAALWRAAPSRARPSTAAAAPLPAHAGTARVRAPPAVATA